MYPQLLEVRVKSEVWHNRGGHTYMQLGDPEHVTLCTLIHSNML